MTFAELLAGAVGLGAIFAVLAFFAFIVAGSIYLIVLMIKSGRRR